MPLEISGTSVIGTTPAGHVVCVSVKEDEPQGAITTSKLSNEPTDSESEPIRGTTMAPPVGTATSMSSPPTSLPPRVLSESPNVSPTAKRRSRPTSRDPGSPYPQSRPSTPNRPATPGSSATSVSRPVPPRRSARTLAKGTDRPHGPPELEAALAIAIRNLESDIYEWWCANQRPGCPVPTTAYLKARSPRIREAAVAVDEADRLLNEAVYGKPKKSRSRAKLPSLPLKAPPGEIPETAFEQLELHSHGSASLRPTVTDTPTSSQPRRNETRARRSLRNIEKGAGDS